VTSVAPPERAALLVQLTHDFAQLANASTPASFLAVLSDVQSALSGEVTAASPLASPAVGPVVDTVPTTLASVPTPLGVGGQDASGWTGLPATLASVPTPLGGPTILEAPSVLQTPQVSGDPGLRAVAAALAQVGVPYVWGGASPSTGFDCSGLVQWAFGQAGISLPRVASAQEQVGTLVPSLADAAPGDLVFYGNPAYHVGIYLGDGYMVDAPETGQTVSIQPVGTPTEIRHVAPGGASGDYGPLFAQATSAYGLPPGLLEAVATVESGMNPNAVSSAGAEGMMQLMPSTAASLGVNPFDPAEAITGAAELLAGKLAKFGSLPLALAAYNAGDGAVERYGTVPPYPQTQQYVSKVLTLMEGASSGQGS